MSKRAEELATRIIAGYWERQDMSRDEAVALIDAELRKALERAAKRAEDHLIDETIITAADAGIERLRSAILAEEED